MDFLGLDLTVKNHPELDTGFVPLAKFFEAYRAGAAHPYNTCFQKRGLL